MDSLLLINKPQGITSFDVVRRVRKNCGTSKVGHAGTLDPFATGLLVMLVGKATKISDWAMSGHKRYRATLRLGISTDTLDITGRPVEEKPIGNYDAAEIERVLKSLEGVFQQTPPMYSAKKIGGQKLYALARQGVTVERKASPVELFEISLVSYVGNEIEFEIYCSKGTYVRVVGEEIAKHLGTTGCLVSLHRLQSGKLRVEEAPNLDEFEQSPVKWLEQGLVRFNSIKDFYKCI